MTRRTDMCQIEECPKKRQKKTIFCKKHAGKIPKKMMIEVRRFFKDHPTGYTAREFDHLTAKCNFSINTRNYEKRYEHYIKSENKRLNKQKIILVYGVDRIESHGLQDEIDQVVVEMGLENDIVDALFSREKLKKIFSNYPACAVILLGEAGVRVTMPPSVQEHGHFTHVFNEELNNTEKNIILTPEECFKNAWKDRPSSPRHSYNYYFSAPVISCEPHPEEYEDFGDGEIREIRKCLEWGKQFLHKGE